MIDLKAFVDLAALIMIMAMLLRLERRVTRLEDKFDTVMRFIDCFEKKDDNV